MRHLLSTLTILSTFTLLTASTLHAQVPSYVPTDGLVGWWPFNGNANDESGNGNNGTVNGATLTFDRLGQSNSAYNFDGLDDLIRIPHQNQLNLMGDFTASIWFDISAIPTSNNGHVFMYKRDDNGICCSPDVPFGFFITYQVSTAPVNFKMPACAFANSGSYNFSTSDSIITINTWNNIIFTYSFDTLKIFLNNTLINDEYFPNSNRSANLSDLLIGSVNRELGAEWMNGVLDDIGIWNRALTAAEVQALYNAQPLTPCISPTTVSFSGLSTSYTTSDGPVALTGAPVGGVFIGPGVNGNSFSPAVAGEGTHGITYMYEDEQGCLNAASLCTSVSLGMGLEPGGNAPGGVRVFPNPNRGQFTVELELAGLVGLQVFDARGALVHNEVFTASGSRTQRTLDLSAFAQGNYTLQVEHDGQRVSQTVVVE